VDLFDDAESEEREEVPVEEEEEAASPAASAPSGESAEPGAPLDPRAQALYDRGYTLYHQGDYVDAETSFRRFLEGHGSSDLSDNAQYWIGECRLARDDLRGALAAFRETVNRYPDGNKVPDALLKTGDVLEKLGDEEGARESYREIQRRFPDSAAAIVASERLGGL
jgi:tol-pal system protein YbgF